jgi:hypothetical protein
VLGPLVLSGRSFHEPLCRAPAGHLVPSDTLKRELKALRGRSSTCPVASRATAGGAAPAAAPLQRLAEDYWRVFQVVSDGATSDGPRDQFDDA